MLHTAHRTLPRRTLRLLTAAAVTAAGLTVLNPTGAYAATTLNVTTTADVPANTGACGSASIVTASSSLSLREATCLANNLGGAVTINIPAGHYVLTNGELAPGINPGQNITIAGAGPNSTIIDGNNASRVFDIDKNIVGGVSASITGVTITGGFDNTFGGAGIIDGSGDITPWDQLTIDNSVITNNVAQGINNPGGGVAMDGGSLSITNTTISGNSSQTEGSGVWYAADNNSGTVPGIFSVTNSVFSHNTVTDILTNNSRDGGALYLMGQKATETVTATTFTGNIVTSDTAETPAGAGIYKQSGTLTVTQSSFVSNTLTGTGAGVQSAAGAAVYDYGTGDTFAYNRIVGNTGGAGAVANPGGSGDSLVAADNWWGCNTGPGTTGCDGTDGTVSTPSYLKLAASASPATVTGPNATSTITASLTTDSTGATVSSSNLGAFAGVPVTFSDPPGDATVGLSGGAKTVNLDSGQAGIDYHSNTTTGPDPLNATLGNATVTAAVTVNHAPAITSADSTRFDISTAGSFTVTTSGYPTPTITETGALPPGVTFTDSRNGTATLAGTPSGGGGSYPLTLTATNGVSPDATQTLTLTVGQPPAFTSPSSATFVAGTAGSFTITTSGNPGVSAITETGILPAGLSFTDNRNGTATLAGTPTGAGGTTTVTLTATNGVTPDATQTLTLQVNHAPVVATDPVGQAVNPGASVTFTAAATGVPTPTVQWQVSTDGGATFTDIPAATGTSYTFTATTGEDGNRYRAVFTNTAGSATTTAATLRVGTAPTFTSSNAATFTVGAAGSFTVTSSGVPNATITTTDPLPNWLTLHDNGDGTATLAGTPPAGSGGSYTITLQAANGFDSTATQTFLLTVDEAPAITSAATTTFTVGTTGSFTVHTTAGYPIATTITHTGLLPAGISFTDNGDGTATLAGTPATGTAGTYPLTLTATAVGGSTSPDTQAFTLTVQGPPAITSTDHTGFTVGHAGSFTVHTTAGYPTATTITRTGALPAGVTFIDNGDGTATLAGTPTYGSGGTYPITLTASNGVDPDATQPFTVTVDQAPVMTSPDHTTFTSNTAAAFTVTTAGANPAATTITESGPLPAGVTFTDNGDGTATLGGTPSPSGVFALTLTASNGVAPDAIQTFTLTVNPPPPATQPPTISSPDHTTFTTGTAGSFTVTTTAGYPTRTTLTVTGTLPDGVAFTDHGDGTGALTGTPTARSGGVYRLGVTADNGATAPATQDFTLTVDEPLVITSLGHVSFTAGLPGRFTITTRTGYPTAATLSENGTLPAGIRFTDNGDGTATLAGTPRLSALGRHVLTLTADNGSASVATQQLLVRVHRAAIVQLPATLPHRDGRLRGVPSPVLAGTVLRVHGRGYAAGAPVRVGVYVNGTPRLLARATANRYGRFSIRVRVPARRGWHTFVAAGTRADGGPRYLERASLLHR